MTRKIRELSSGGALQAEPAAPGAVSVRVYLPAQPLRGYVTFHSFVEAFGPLTDFLDPE
jgi:hypothetical protein